MALFVNVNNEKRKIVKLFANVGGVKTELNKLQVRGADGTKKTIFSKYVPTVRTLVANLIPKDNDSEETVTYDIQSGVVYEVWAIGNGGNGGDGGSGWLFYHGGGGSAGTAGGVVYAKFKMDGPSPCTITLYSNNSSNWVNSADYFAIGGNGLVTFSDFDDEIEGSTYNRRYALSISAGNGQSGRNGSDADWSGNGSGGSSAYGSGDSKCITTTLSEHVFTILEQQIYNSDPSEAANGANGSPAPNPVQTPYTVPPYLAQVGQDAYYSTDLNSLCLGNAGGGGNEEQTGGKGAPGGVLLYAYV